MFRNVPECSGMFRNVPGCSMFRVLSTAECSRLLENLVLGKKSNQQTKTMRTKTNYKPKANDKGKENNAIFFETWPSSV